MKINAVRVFSIFVVCFYFLFNLCLQVYQKNSIRTLEKEIFELKESRKQELYNHGVADFRGVWKKQFQLAGKKYE